jgi:23S rRNA (cytidine1920-2'-O)/16S rRNA (cytidine1409-2'-O)-methyltransferase
VQAQLVALAGGPGERLGAEALDRLLGVVEVRKGLVRDEAIHARVVDEVAAAAAEVRLARVGLTPSPITGQKGNIEFLLHLRQA